MSALTKILIVLQLVFSVAVSVLLVLMISRQENYKDLAGKSSASYLAQSATLTKAQSDASIAGQQVLKANSDKDKAEQALADAKREANATASKAQSENLELSAGKRALEAQVQAMTAANNTLSQSNAKKDEELASLRPAIIDAMGKNNDLAKRNNEMESQNRALELAIRKLQESAAGQASTSGASSGGSTGTVQMMSSAPAASAAINAKITEVRETSGRTMVELPLGSRDGITENTPLFIYRGSNGYVADAVVQRVTPTASVAVITKTREGQTVQAGDTISTIGK